LIKRRQAEEAGGREDDEAVNSQRQDSIVPQMVHVNSEFSGVPARRVADFATELEPSFPIKRGEAKGPTESHNVRDLQVGLSGVRYRVKAAPRVLE
jgi:hypothetical protein